ncbi:MAG: hypothetical protein AMS20_13045 [Gemmatimonas sp. SG8_28]|nr:MAG: hypothetical protein AMS20_13045 [Gemmatimonas sp. SG8_28]
MRHYVFPITIAALVVARPLAAQYEGPADGDRVRATVGADSTVVEGSYAGLRDHALFLERAGVTLRIGLDSVHLLEQELRRGFDSRKGLRWAAIGGGMGAAVAVYGLVFECAMGEQGIAGECYEQSAGEAVLFTGALIGSGAVLGMVFGGGGSNAKRGGIIGFVAGSVVGAVAGAAAYESPDCSPDAFMCLDFGPGFTAVAGAAVGGVAVGFVGAVVGALTGEAEWVPVSSGDLRVGIAPVADGLGLIGSFTF